MPKKPLKPNPTRLRDQLQRRGLSSDVLLLLVAPMTVETPGSHGIFDKHRYPHKSMLVYVAKSTDLYTFLWVCFLEMIFLVLLTANPCFTLFYPFQAKLSSQTSCGRMSMVTTMAIIGVRDMNLRGWNGWNHGSARLLFFTGMAGHFGRWGVYQELELD